MKRRHIASLVIVAPLIFVVGMALAAQDRFTVRSPDGIAFSEFKGYDAWQVIALSGTDEGCLEGRCVKAILGNAVASGAPGVTSVPVWPRYVTVTGPTGGATAPPEGGNVGLYEAGWPCQVAMRVLPPNLIFVSFTARQ
jgi:hypothetical protein